MDFNYQQQPGLHPWNRALEKSGAPLVSIITPFYNGGTHFKQTFNCVIDQTFPWFEWIIVDDGSTKEADVTFLCQLAKTDPRVRVLHKENGGIASARNMAIRHSTTDYILPLDCDDLLEPTFLEYCWWMLIMHPDAAWSYTDCVGFQQCEYLWSHRFDPIRLKSENHLTATALIRKERLLKIGCYAEIAKSYNEDWYVWLKIVADKGFPVQSTNDYLFWYRRNDTGVLARVQSEKKEHKLNKVIIAKAAKEIVSPCQPIIHPHAFFANFCCPRFYKWDKSIFHRKTKMQITFLVPWLEIGGADKFNLDLISRLDKDRFEIAILTTEQSSNPWIQDFRRQTPEVFCLANFMVPSDYAAFISYFIQSRETDILFLSNSYVGYYLIPWLREHFPHMAIVDYVHMEEWYWRNGGFARTSGAIGNITEKTYVCNSATREALIGRFGRAPESVEVVHIGVDEKSFDRTIVSPGLCYEKIGITPGRPIVLFICRLHPQKRPFLMLRIAQMVKKNIPNIAFVVVGDGAQEDELRHCSSAWGLNDTVFFMGAQKEVRPYYRDAKITLICSLKEGLALTAYESCAMGVPVVSADVGGQKDLVDDSTGALIACRQSEANDLDMRDFDIDEVSDYAAAIAKILSNEDLWTKLSINCRQRIEAGFTIDKMVRIFDMEFERLTQDIALQRTRERSTATLRLLSPLAADYLTMELQLQSVEDDLRYFAGKCNPQCQSNETNLSGSIKANIRQSLQLAKQILRHAKQILRHAKQIFRLGMRKIKRHINVAR